MCARCSGCTRILLLAGLALWGGSAGAQPAAVRSSLSAADPDPTADQPVLDMRALPLESRTDLLDHVGLDTPGVLRLEDGVGIYGGTARETQLTLDGVRVSRLSVPLAMLGTVQVDRAGYGAPLADATGGAVGAHTRTAVDRWGASLDTFQDRGEPRSETVSLTAAGPLLKRRLHLLLGLQLAREEFEPAFDSAGIFPNAPPVEGSDGRAAMKLTVMPGAGQQIELLAVGTMASQENSPMLGRAQETQPRWEDSYGLLAARWGSRFGRSWLARAHLAFEGSGTRLFPKQCLTQANCYEIPVVVYTGPRYQSQNYELRSEQRQRAVDTQLTLQRTLPDRPHWQWAIRAGSRLQVGWHERLWQVPGNQRDEYVGGVPSSRTTYYPDDPRLGPVEPGPVRTSWNTLRAVQFVELPVRVMSRLQLLPGVGLVSARGEFGDLRPGSNAFTHHLAAEFIAYRPWQLTVRASTHRRADADLDHLEALTAVEPISRRCLFNPDTGSFDRECAVRGGRLTSVGLPCGPTGLTADGASCRQVLGLPRTWEHTLGAGMDLGLGLRLDMDVIERRTSGTWARLETNRVWNVIGSEVTFEGYRNGRTETLFDVSVPAGPSRRHRALTTALTRTAGLATLSLAHSYGRTRNPLHPVPGLVIIDDDGGRHFVHMQSVLNLGFGSIGVRYRYAQGERVLPLYLNTVTGAWEPYRARGLSGPSPGSGTTLRHPSANQLSIQARVSLRRVLKVADAQLYADALNLVGSRQFTRVGQQDGRDYGLLLGPPVERWYRIGLQAGF